MEKLLNKINLFYAAATTVLAAIFGQYWFLFVAFLALNIADYITGVIKAKMFHKENSNKGLKGIMKKVGYWLVIAIAFFISLAFEEFGKIIGINLAFVEFFGWFTLGAFIINEVRSILENLIIMGVEVPAFLIQGLEVASDAIQKKTGKGDDDK